MGACYSESHIKYDMSEQSIDFKSSEISRETSPNLSIDRKVCLNDFECLKVLGRVFIHFEKNLYQ
jgi:hypothetical protein